MNCSSSPPADAIPAPLDADILRAGRTRIKSDRSSDALSVITPRSGHAWPRGSVDPTPARRALGGAGTCDASVGSPDLGVRVVTPEIRSAGGPRWYRVRIPLAVSSASYPGS